MENRKRIDIFCATMVALLLLGSALLPGFANAAEDLWKEEPITCYELPALSNTKRLPTVNLLMASSVLAYATKGSNCRAAIAARKSLMWLTLLDVKSCDLNSAQMEIIEYISKISKAMEK